MQCEHVTLHQPLTMETETASETYTDALLEPLSGSDVMAVGGDRMMETPPRQIL
jgi:hypothetical protein